MHETLGRRSSPCVALTLSPCCLELHHVTASAGESRNAVDALVIKIAASTAAALFRFLTLSNCPRRVPLPRDARSSAQCPPRPSYSKRMKSKQAVGPCARRDVGSLPAASQAWYVCGNFASGSLALSLDMPRDKCRLHESRWNGKTTKEVHESRCARAASPWTHRAI